MSKELEVHPSERRLGSSDRSDPIEQFSHRPRCSGPDTIEYSGRAIFCHADHPFCKISDINDLHRIGRFTGSEDLTTTVDTHRPVREAIGLVTWADNESRTNDIRAAYEDSLCCAL